MIPWRVVRWQAITSIEVVLVINFLSVSGGHFGRLVSERLGNQIIDLESVFGRDLFVRA